MKTEHIIGYYRVWIEGAETGLRISTKNRETGELENYYLPNHITREDIIQDYFDRVKRNE